MTIPEPPPEFASEALTRALGIVAGEPPVSDRGVEITKLLDRAEPIVGGYRLAADEVRDFYIDLNAMLFNWRLCIGRFAEIDRGYLAGFCYFGTGPESLAKALRAGYAWAEAAEPLDGSPVGYDKAAYDAR